MEKSADSTYNSVSQDTEVLLQQTAQFNFPIFSINLQKESLELQKTVISGHKEWELMMH